MTRSIFTLLLTIFASFLSGQEDYTPEVYVLDSISNKPVIEASVFYTYGKYWWVQTTDTNGNCPINKIRSKFKIEIHCPGYETRVIENIKMKDSILTFKILQDDNFKNESVNLLRLENKNIIQGKKRYNIVRYGSKDAITTLGNYDNDKRVGTWLYYDVSGQLIAKGKYKEGQKVGKWFYLKNGVEYTVNHKFEWETANVDIYENGQLQIVTEIYDLKGRYSKFIHGERVLE